MKLLLRNKGLVMITLIFPHNVQSTRLEPDGMQYYPALRRRPMEAACDQKVLHVFID